jgi:hypothetical protein
MISSDTKSILVSEVSEEGGMVTTLSAAGKRPANAGY